MGTANRPGDPGAEATFLRHRGKGRPSSFSVCHRCSLPGSARGRGRESGASQADPERRDLLRIYPQERAARRWGGRGGWGATHGSQGGLSHSHSPALGGLWRVTSSPGAGEAKTSPWLGLCQGGCAFQVGQNVCQESVSAVPPREKMLIVVMATRARAGVGARTELGPLH